MGFPATLSDTAHRSHNQWRLMLPPRSHTANAAALHRFRSARGTRLPAAGRGYSPADPRRSTTASAGSVTRTVSSTARPTGRTASTTRPSATSTSRCDALADPTVEQRRPRQGRERRPDPPACADDKSPPKPQALRDRYRPIGAPITVDIAHVRCDVPTHRWIRRERSLTPRSTRACTCRAVYCLNSNHREIMRSASAAEGAGQTRSAGPSGFGQTTSSG